MPSDDASPAAAGAQAAVRVDSWLWAVRVYKTRSQATAACRAGHVRVGDERVKASQSVRPGDEVRVRIAGADRILVVRRTLVKRVGPAVAAEALTDLTPPPPARDATPATVVRDRGAGRPTKRDRRDIERLRDPEGIRGR
ncbi:RNA-binding S4 domain-containing protein [Clavibacter zhangzhiyongii]|uniref:RNA-binding S4 domain-containing protein n=1 Tax=Clavibacter zhangzhiyongii TaxID=2768071 RepID=A0A7L7YZN3_9MICO|nr:S4 domain-containing protein [Clavibacter zhangzhiyongii]QOD42877.1 RNA-binding S4 domain-containing protein [Clavibacter zhangzhiyongii]